MFINEQHGFRPGRSTVTHLLSFNSFLLEAIESGLQVDVIYTDLKPFDSVNHTSLVNKLKLYGVSQCFLTRALIWKKKH